MSPVHTPGSFTKNFSWNLSYKPLHTAIRNGFEKQQAPTTRDNWRAQSGIADKNRQLIPLNFFLYCKKGNEEDYVLVDQIVRVAIEHKYGPDFDQLALFVFHLSHSGSWAKSQWVDGRVAGWANDFIREISDTNGNWSKSAFSEVELMRFIEERVHAEPVTIRKIFTNYRFMLRSAGILQDGQIQAPNLRQRWFVDAIQLFWDRKIFDGELHPDASRSTFESKLLEHEVQKLLRCNEDQCRTFARAAFGEYSAEDAIEQIEELRKSGRIAA